MVYTRVSNLIFIVIILSALAGTADAGILVTPERQVVTLSPKESETVEYQVYNSGPGDLDILFDIKDWTGEGILKSIDIDSWLTLKEDNLSVGEGETKPFHVTVTAPDEVEGEMVGMLFLCYKEDKASPLNIRNGTPLYLVIEGTQKYTAKIKDIKIGYAADLKKDALAIKVDVKNEGNVRIVPDIKVSIKNSKGEELKNFLFKRLKTILRGRPHTYEFTWRNIILPKGNYTITAELDYEGELTGTKVGSEFNVTDKGLEIGPTKAKS